ncbi:hypothetical protein A1O1_01066 [Capronia coronata CBS 617.96]|uniref:Uncharacterized protein n=1 Tax=Capronia coronata CBS 617.96 TaxID=1182541 RepID=W9Z2Z4_9EURO|nr:uncharacterized protein A1O1_01066 [Capronia coronata CBS 617.96]EXJ95941.1 hypothetical protein A1O1_01066 [Capronia coronata CBS 617.96]
MHTVLGFLASVSLAIEVASTQSFGGVVTVVPHSGPLPPLPPPPPSPPASISTSTVDDTIIYTCPPVPTVFLDVTHYVNVPVTVTATALYTDTSTASFTNTATELLTDTTTASIINTTTAFYTDTTTQPITIYQTIISTTILTTTEIVTETSTTVSPSPTTATATEKLILQTFTTEVTSVTVCPTRTANPTFTALGPLPTDWTWGCPPGWLCKPLQENCNFEAGLPEQNFYCAPNECIPAQALPEPLSTWSNDIYGNFTPIDSPGLTIQAIDDYFNMDPTEFGLSYQIFIVEEVYTVTSTTLLLPTPTVGARQAQTSVPGACYPWCNNCLLEAQARGKTSALCVPGSAFEVSLSQCEQCIDVHKADNVGSFVQVAPQFQQFLDYCAQFLTIVVTTSVTATATNAQGSTFSTLSVELYTTVTPKISGSTLTSAVPHTSLTTVVGTTVTNATPSLTSSTETIAISTSTATASVASLSKSVSANVTSRTEATSVVVTVSSETLPVIVTTTTAVTSRTSLPTSSGSPYVTTAAVSTTLYSLSTITGSQWSQITIILPLADNSTTTVYGSDLTGGATLVLPGSSTITSYLTTMTLTPGILISGIPSSISATFTGPATMQSTTPPITPSAFTGGTSGLKATPGDLRWQPMLGLVIACAAVLLV